MGSRNASARVSRSRDRLARDLAEADFVVVSGLARGIDQRAHRGALATGTVAVLAAARQDLSAESTWALAQRSAKRGAVISEMPLGWEPRGRDFPRRNRIVSGLSLGTSWSRRRGVRVRSSPRASPTSRAGRCSPCRARRSIRGRRAATIFRARRDAVHERRDVIEALAPIIAGGVQSRANLCDDDSLSPSRTAVGRNRTVRRSLAPLTEPALELDDEGCRDPPEPCATGRRDAASPRDAMDRFSTARAAPVSVDDLVRASGFGVAQVHAALFDLELGGRLVRHGGTLVALRPE